MNLRGIIRLNICRLTAAGKNSVPYRAKITFFDRMQMPTIKGKAKINKYSKDFSKFSFYDLRDDMCNLDIIGNRELLKAAAIIGSGIINTVAAL